MADVKATLAEWSATTNSNHPQGTVSVGTGMDDNLRELAGVVVRGLSHKGADIPSVAGTTDIGAVEGLMNDVTGTEIITSFGTVRAGILKILKFEGAATLTHNATSLILKGGMNRVTADGDVGIYISEGSGNWRELVYAPASTGLSLLLTSTDAGATAGPELTLYRNSATPAANDEIGVVKFSGEDSAGNTEVYAHINTQVIDPTSTSEDARIELATVIAGTLAERAFLGAGLFMAGASDPGGGAIAATSVVINSDSLAGLATQAEMEAVAANNKWVSPARQHLHPGSSKGWIKYTGAGSTLASYNVSSLTNTGVGDESVNWSTAFASADYAVSVSSTSSSTVISNQTAALVKVLTFDNANAAEEAASAYVIAFGDFA